MASFNRALQKLAKWVFKCFFVFGTVSFAFLLCILFYNVVSRNLLSGAVTWIEEFSRMVFTWMMFLGIAIGVYYRKHLGVDFIVEKYPPKLKTAIGYFSDILMLVLFIVLTIYGFKYCKSTINMRSPALNLRYGRVYLCVPLCGIFSSFYCIVDIFNRVFGDKEEKKEEIEA